jgi:hypothetical protein
LETNLHRKYYFSNKYIQTLNNLHSADDQVLTVCSADNLHRAVFTLQHILKAFGMEISPENWDNGVLVQDPVRRKIVAEHKCLQVNNFKYLGFEIS